MRRSKHYKTAGKFLEASAAVRVRFQEVDVLQVVWHGHYLTYFEEARNAFGREYGFDYQDILRAGYIVPLVHAEVDYFAPARFGDTLTVRARLYPEEAARILFNYEISAAGGQKLATGCSMQVFTDRDGRLVLTRPRFYLDFLARWESRMVEE